MSIMTRLMSSVVILASVTPLPIVAKDVNRAKVLERRLAGVDGAIMVVAHRGCWKQTSENSVDGIEACIAFGVDMVELDVRATADGKLILMHDATVDRMTDGIGKVEALDWAYLQTLHLREGAGRGAPLTTRRIPTFEEALRAAKGRILINIDAKSDLTQEVLAEVDRFGDRKQVLFKSATPGAELIATSPWLRDVRFQPIIRERDMQGDPKLSIAPYDKLKPVGYEIDVVNPPIIATLAGTIRKRCARFWVNSLNGTPAIHDAEAMLTPDRVWGRMIADGVDTIQTDEPLALKAYVASKGLTGRRC